jgi:hypothetical protein
MASSMSFPLSLLTISLDSNEDLSPEGLEGELGVDFYERAYMNIISRIMGATVKQSRLSFNQQLSGQAVLKAYNAGGNKAGVPTALCHVTYSWFDREPR